MDWIDWLTLVVCIVGYGTYAVIGGWLVKECILKK